MKLICVAIIAVGLGRAMSDFAYVHSFTWNIFSGLLYMAHFVWNMWKFLRCEWKFSCHSFFYDQNAEGAQRFHHWNSLLELLMSGWSSSYPSIQSRFSYRHVYCRHCNIYEVTKMWLDSLHLGEQHYQHGCFANLWVGSSTEVCMATDLSKAYIFIKLHGNLPKVLIFLKLLITIETPI